MTIEDGTVLFFWAVIVALRFQCGRCQRNTERALALLRRSVKERAALQQWLNVLGWNVYYSEDRTVIERGAVDPEEERLKR